MPRTSWRCAIEDASGRRYRLWRCRCPTLRRLGGVDRSVPLLGAGTVPDSGRSPPSDEFQAIDRPLTDRQMRELREIFTRATITRTLFSNYYTYGDLKANPRDLLARYFDASLCLTHWHRLAERPAWDSTRAATSERVTACDVKSWHFESELAGCQGRSLELALNAPLSAKTSMSMRCYPGKKQGRTPE